MTLRFPEIFTKGLFFLVMPLGEFRKPLLFLIYDIRFF